MADELNAANVGQIGTGLLGHLIIMLHSKGVITSDDVQALKDSVVADAPKEKTAAVRAFIDRFIEV